LAAGDQVCIGTKDKIPPGVLYYYRSFPDSEGEKGNLYPVHNHAYLFDMANDNKIQLLNPWGYNSLENISNSVPLEKRHLSDVVSDIYILNSTKVQ
jgi:hypothetical protein